MFESILKWVSGILIFLLALYGNLQSFFPDDGKFAWMKNKICRIVVFVVSVIVGFLSLFMSYLQDKAEKDLRQKIVQSNAEIKNVNGKLDFSNAMLKDSEDANKRLTALVSEQSKSVNSLVFNMQTSIEGKLRFKEIFETLSLLAAWDNSQLLYCCQLCDSGVGLFWFDQGTEILKGFCFFNNSEINKILSETPIDSDFVDENGVVVVKKDSQLAAVYKQVLEQTTPIKQGVAPAQRKASLEIDSLIKELLVFVCRGKDVNVVSFRREKTSTYSGDKRVTFVYCADPTVRDPKFRPVQFDLSSSFMDGLYGIERRAFSERVIDELKRLKVRPMVTPSIINYFNNEWLAKKGASTLTVVRNFDAGDDSGQILGIHNLNISQGLNRVVIDCRAVGTPFSTLDKVFRFSPAENFVGDRIELDLDGATQSYFVEKWDPDTANYVLSAKRLGKVDFVTLASIPCVDEVSIIHETSTPLSLSKYGGVAGEFLKLQKESAPNRYDGVVVPKRITIKPAQ